MSYPVKKAARIPCDKRKRIRALLPQRCAKCGTTKALTLDHIVARGLGGTNELSNLQLLCYSCNRTKGFHEAKEAAARLEEERQMQKQEKAAYFREQARLNPPPPKAPSPSAPPSPKKVIADLNNQAHLLRQRIQQLESQAQKGEVKHTPETAALQKTIDTLRAELDKEKGITRVGRHVVSLSSLLKSLRRVFKYTEQPAEIKVRYVERMLENAEALLDGREPADWLDKPEA